MPAPPPPCGRAPWPPCIEPPQPAVAAEIKAYALRIIEWYETPEGRAEVEGWRRSEPSPCASCGSIKTDTGVMYHKPNCEDYARR